MSAPETLGPRVVQHLLSRAGYGPRPGEIDAVLKSGPTKWIEEQLDPGPDPELDQRLARYPTLSYPTSRVLALYNADPRSIDASLRRIASDVRIYASMPCVLPHVVPSESARRPPDVES